MPVPTSRCPSCGVLNAADQHTCIRCLAPLSPLVPVDAEPVTGETCKIYRATSTHATLLITRSALEYIDAMVALHTPWHNVASIAHGPDDDYLRLLHTPTTIKLRLGSSRLWFSDRTRSIPLRQFGYPLNSDLLADLACFAPQLRRRWE